MRKQLKAKLGQMPQVAAADLDVAEALATIIANQNPAVEAPYQHKRGPERAMTRPEWEEMSVRDQGWEFFYKDSKTKLENLAVADRLTVVELAAAIVGNDVQKIQEVVQRYNGHPESLYQLIQPLNVVAYDTLNESAENKTLDELGYFISGSWPDEHGLFLVTPHTVQTMESTTYYLLP